MAADGMDSRNPQAGNPPGEALDLLALFTFLWSRRIHILLASLFAAVGGLGYGYLATPMYQANSTICPKEQGGGGGGSSALLSQLGGFGSVVAGQLGVGNADISRLELMAGSRDLSEFVVRQNNLLPRLFPKQWDPKAKAWKDGKGPSVRDAAEFLKYKVLSVSADPKKGALTLRTEIHDAALASQLIEYYLDALGATIKMNVRSDADSNRKYLEHQLSETTDPLLREKIQQLIGVEIEKSMLVSSKSFDVVERPVVPRGPSKPHKARLAAMAFLIGMLVTSLALVAAKAFRENAALRVLV